MQLTKREVLEKDINFQSDIASIDVINKVSVAEYNTPNEINSAEHRSITLVPDKVRIDQYTDSILENILNVDKEFHRSSYQDIEKVIDNIEAQSKSFKYKLIGNLVKQAESVDIYQGDSLKGLIDIVEKIQLLDAQGDYILPEEVISKAFEAVEFQLGYSTNEHVDLLISLHQSIKPEHYSSLIKVGASNREQPVQLAIAQIILNKNILEPSKKALNLQSLLEYEHLPAHILEAIEKKM